MGGSLPGLPLVIDLSNWLQSNALVLFGGLGIALFSTAKFYGTPKGRVIGDQILLKLPVMGDVMTKVAVARSVERWVPCCHPVFRLWKH